MKTFMLQAIHATASKRPPGYVEEVLSHGTVEGDKVTLSDEAYQLLVEKYRGVKAKPAPKIQPLQQGPGTELKALLKTIGITASPGCSCNARAKKMDDMGSDWCEENIETVCDWLQEEASKRKLPFLRTAGKLLIRRAISNSRKKGQ